MTKQEKYLKIAQHYLLPLNHPAKERNNNRVAFLKGQKIRVLVFATKDESPMGQMPWDDDYEDSVFPMEETIGEGIDAITYEWFLVWRNWIEILDSGRPVRDLFHEKRNVKGWDQEIETTFRDGDMPSLTKQELAGLKAEKAEETRKKNLPPWRGTAMLECPKCHGGHFIVVKKLDGKHKGVTKENVLMTETLCHDGFGFDLNTFEFQCCNCGNKKPTVKVQPHRTCRDMK